MCDVARWLAVSLEWELRETQAGEGLPDFIGTDREPRAIGWRVVRPLMKMGRRYKVYAAETGVTYHYFFEARRRVVRPEGQGAGSDFTFVVTADQQSPFTLRIFVAERAFAAWREAHGRDLDSNEQYAAAKMRLFRAFDEHAHLRGEGLNLLVDETNVHELLEPLHLA